MNNDLDSSLPFIEGRGYIFCRGCLGRELFTGLDLGDLPIANELLNSYGQELETFPLHLRICANCGLGQVADVVNPERIFRDYRYLSSMSTTFLQHAADFVNECVKDEMFSSGDWALEIASNDGYLLKNFLSYGINVLGIEPAKNVAEIARKQGIETISEFFTSNLASQLLITHGYPKLIIANNVMAHVPDLGDFIKGLATLCGPQTHISIENPSLSNILIGMQFDTVYHEHYSYLSASSVEKISKIYGLSLHKVEDLTIHGGSNRYWLNKTSDDLVADNSVQEILKFEAVSGLFDRKEWLDYSEKVNKILSEFHSWLHSRKKENCTVFGYGAAAKASTLLNSINLEEELIHAIADASQEKQNRFMPPHGIAIISPDQLFGEKPTDIVIFPWNIKTEIAKFLSENLGSEVRMWCAIPEMHRVIN